ncbi:hypothetical protein WDA79_03645 [Streptomyces sp. A475]|uniref:hypothetical protein n=1 Tax=Streptomyces sp. A475 TaxID=3131976 RepID=UPI0030C964D7
MGAPVSQRSHRPELRQVPLHARHCLALLRQERSRASLSRTRHHWQHNSEGFGDRYKGLLVDALPVLRWEIDSSAHPLPDALLADWHGNPSGTVPDYPGGHVVAPVISRKLADETRAAFQSFGTYVPVHVPDGGPDDVVA